MFILHRLPSHTHTHVCERASTATMTQVVAETRAHALIATFLYSGVQK